MNSELNVHAKDEDDINWDGMLLYIYIKKKKLEKKIIILQNCIKHTIILEITDDKLQDFLVSMVRMKIILELENDFFIRYLRRNDPESLRSKQRSPRHKFHSRSIRSY